MNNEPSTLDPRLYGLIYITGAYGVGKTTLATTAENPKRTAILDFDLKFKIEAEGLGFWYRSPDHVKDIFQMNLDEMATWLKASMSEIPEGTTTVVFDNASQLEALLGYIVGKDPERYGVNPTNAKTGAYGGVNPGVGRLWKNIVLYLQKRGVRVVIVVAHVGSPWMDGKPVPNKFKGKGSKILQELSNLSVVLTRDDKPEPSAIVLKEQFARRIYKSGEWTIQRVFPLRFPKASWKHILAYLDKPADFENPTEGETPSKDEMNMYSDLFTKQQIEFMKAVVNGTYTEDGDAPTISPKEDGPVEKKPGPEPKKTFSTLDDMLHGLYEKLGWQREAAIEKLHFHGYNGKPSGVKASDYFTEVYYGVIAKEEALVASRADQTPLFPDAPTGPGAAYQE